MQVINLNYVHIDEPIIKQDNLSRWNGTRTPTGSAKRTKEVNGEFAGRNHSEAFYSAKQRQQGHVLYSASVIPINRLRRRDNEEESYCSHCTFTVHTLR